MSQLEDIEKRYGTRPKIPMGHGERLLTEHMRGELPTGEKFVYCPVGFILSWHPLDHDNWWCHWCQKYLKEFV